MTARSALWLATRDLHHRAEQHPVGAAMAAGTMREDWWADWLGALLTVHRALDPHMPAELRRVAELEADLRDMAREPRPNPAAAAYAETLTSDRARRGAAYVFCGAHLMGGAITERQNGGRLPCAHLRWDDRRAALDAWRPMREAEDMIEEARAAFAATLAILREIEPDTEEP